MSLRQTQLQAWQDLQPKLGRRQEAVYEYIHGCGSYGATNAELCEGLGKTPNEISGRLTELSDMARIRDRGIRVNPRSGKNQIVWIATETERRHL